MLPTDHTPKQLLDGQTRYMANIEAKSDKRLYSTKNPCKRFKKRIKRSR